ncbi:MAG: hypothetical protein HY515_02510 [Candidatus Aenigmarchaeota archaeon]|nr:hypothetical protein [Candidatus Aenigmarchaeota archaeon]
MFEPFNPDSHGERKVERVLGRIRGELQPAYKGRLLTGYLPWEATGCFGNVYTAGTCYAIIEEQEPVEKRYLFGLVKKEGRPLRTVVAVRHDHGFDPLVVDVMDESARNVARKHLEPYAQEHSVTIAFTFEPDWVEKLVRAIDEKLSRR